MKTRLLQDLDESGSAPAQPFPGMPHRPAVWHRPPPDAQAGQQARRHAGAGSIQGAAPAAEPVRPRAATPPPSLPADFLTGIPPRADPDPGWLAERLRLDAAEHSRTERAALWRRRALTWGLAGVLLAAAAAGGLWLYRENQVDGALVVLANTSPPQVAPPSERLVRPVPAQAAAPAPAQDAPAAVESLAEPPAAATPVSRARPAARPRKERVRTRAMAGEDDAARQRREEMRLQCQAYGYDEQQCRRRRCEMTPYGFVCKG